MSAPSDATHLPARNSEEFEALQRAVSDAIGQGDIAALQQLGAAAIAHVNLSAVLCALRVGQLPVLAWLVEESERTGIDVADAWKPAHLAALQGDLDKLKTASDEELAMITVSHTTVLHAAAQGDQVEAIEYLVRERGVDVQLRDGLASTALETASRYGNLSAIEALVACGACLHDVPGRPSRALVSAAVYSQVAALEKLVELGADITVEDHSNGTVHAAARAGSVEVIEAAVRLGADPCAVNSRGQTAIHAAAGMTNPAVVIQLAQLGVPIDAVDIFGRTALFQVRFSPPGCRVLLELGADRWIKDDEGCTARDIAVRARFASDEVVELLDAYWPIVPCMAQLLLGLRGPTESPLTQFAAHSAFEPKVLSLVNCLLTGKDDKAYEQLVEEA